MLSGSALLRVLMLILATGALVGIGRTYWSTGAAGPDRPVAVAPPQAAPIRRAEPAPPPRTVEAAATPVRTALPVPPTAPAPGGTGEARSLFNAPPSTREAAVPAAPVPPESRPVAAERRVASADPEVPVAALVDLNTGSLAELNALRGGGSVGRAIIQHRPYGAVDQLLSKRVLSRALYQRLKDQVTVR